MRAAHGPRGLLLRATGQRRAASEGGATGQRQPADKSADKSAGQKVGAQEPEDDDDDGDDGDDPMENQDMCAAVCHKWRGCTQHG